MSRLTIRKYGEIVSNKREKNGIYCSNFCNNCSQGSGNCEYVKDMIEKLADYEDLEEQGLLLKLPCKIGNTVYAIDTIYECKHDYLDCPMEFPDAYQCEINYKCEYEYEKLVVRPIIFKYEMLKDFNKTVFLTKEEAEKELERLNNEKN